MNRGIMRERSNNAKNPNQNVCAQRVAMALGVADKQRYLHTWGDLQSAIRKGGWSCRSRMSKVGKGATVGGSRKTLAKNSAKENSHTESVRAYVVMVQGHVLLLSPEGKTIVDTAPRQNDRRKILAIKAVIDPFQEEIGQILRGEKGGNMFSVVE